MYLGTCVVTSYHVIVPHPTIFIDTHDKEGTCYVPRYSPTGTEQRPASASRSYFDAFTFDTYHRKDKKGVTSLGSNLHTQIALEYPEQFRKHINYVPCDPKLGSYIRERPSRLV